MNGMKKTYEEMTHDEEYDAVYKIALSAMCMALLRGSLIGEIGYPDCFREFRHYVRFRARGYVEVRMRNGMMREFYAPFILHDTPTS